METNSHHPNSHPLLGRGDDPGEVVLCAISLLSSDPMRYIFGVCVCTHVRVCTCLHVCAHIGVHVSWCTRGGQRTYADISPLLPPCLGQDLSLSARQPGPQASRHSVPLFPISLEEHWMTNMHSTLSDSV